MILTDWFFHALTPVTIALASTSVVGGAGTKATITLATAAPTGGAIVTVAGAPPVRISGGSNQVSLIGQIGPIGVRVPQGATQVTIDIFTAGVATLTTSTITAKSGADSSVATLTVRPASIVSVSLSPASVVGGQSPSLQIVLDGAAPAGTGVDVPLTTSQSSALGDGSVRAVTTAALVPTTPAGVHVPPGASILNVPIPTTPVSHDQSLLLTAQLGRSVSVPLIIKAPGASSITLQPNVVTAGSSTQALVTLSGPAPAGFVVPVATNRPDVTVSSPVAVPEGATSATFNVTTSPTTATSSAVTATVGVIGAAAGTPGSIPDGTSNTISLGGPAIRVSATLSVVPPVSLELFALRPTTAKSGTNVIASLKLPSTAAAAATVKLSTDHPELIAVPTSVTVPVSPVATPFTFRTRVTTTETVATVTATVGTQQLSVRLTLVP